MSLRVLSRNFGAGAELPWAAAIATPERVGEVDVVVESGGIGYVRNRPVREARIGKRPARAVEASLQYPLPRGLLRQFKDLAHIADRNAKLVGDRLRMKIGIGEVSLHIALRSHQMCPAYRPRRLAQVCRPGGERQGDKVHHALSELGQKVGANLVGFFEQ